MSASDKHQMRHDDILHQPDIKPSTSAGFFAFKWRYEPSGISPGHLASMLVALKASFAVLVGYMVMGTAWGIVAFTHGFSLLNTILTALVIFSGSLQFLLVGMLSAGASVVEIVFAAALLNSRYFFYVLGAKSKIDCMPMIKRLISLYCINDESFAIISARKYPCKVVFHILWFCYGYWLLGCLSGYMLASILKGDFTSLGFSLNALFIVLAYELIRKCKSGFVLVLAFSAAIIAWVAVPTKFMLLTAVLLSFGVLLLAREIKII